MKAGLENAFRLPDTRIAGQILGLVHILYKEKTYENSVIPNEYYMGK